MSAQTCLGSAYHVLQTFISGPVTCQAQKGQTFSIESFIKRGKGRAGELWVVAIVPSRANDVVRLLDLCVRNLPPPAPVRICAQRNGIITLGRPLKWEKEKEEEEAIKCIQPSRTPQPFVQKGRVLNDEKSQRRQTKQMPST